MTNIKLRELRQKDIDGMYEWIHDEKINCNFRFATKDRTEIETFIKQSGLQREAGTDFYYAITDESDEYLGTVSLKNVDADAKTAEYAIVLRQCAQGKGVACQATDQILSIAFTRLCLKRIYLNVLTENVRACTFYEKYGFQYEGQFQNHLYINGVIHSLCWYAMSADEYLRREKKLASYKVSIVIPVYYNEDNIEPLYEDLKEKVIQVIDYDYEIIFVNDGSKDRSLEKLKKIALKDKNIKIINLSRNFGSHAAILCGLSQCTGDCAVVKAADLQEPSQLILQMVKEWRKGNKVVLAVREARQEKFSQKLFANLYYALIRRVALSNMPKGGFDVYLLDRKVMTVLEKMDERNSALTGQILWSGFTTAVVPYTRLGREIGKSRWTFRKKFRLVTDTLFGFSTIPITIVVWIGSLSFIGALVWAVLEIILKACGLINVSGWTMMFIFNLFSFGVIMFTLGILGGYMWRTFDASRKRPPYIIEDEYPQSTLRE